MEIEDLLKESREIWSEKKMILSEIVPAMGTVFGDICRWQRNTLENKGIPKDEELKKELGNIIFSTIRWCDDLGFDIEECIDWLRMRRGSLLRIFRLRLL